MALMQQGTGVPVVGGNLETATLPIVAVAALGHPGAHKLTEQALEGIAHLGMVCGGRGQRATMASEEIAAVLLFDFYQPTQLTQQGTRPGDSLAQLASRYGATLHQLAPHLMHHPVELGGGKAPSQDVE